MSLEIGSPATVLVSRIGQDGFRGTIPKLDLWPPLTWGHMHTNSQVLTYTHTHTGQRQVTFAVGGASLWEGPPPITEAASIARLT